MKSLRLLLLFIFASNSYASNLMCGFEGMHFYPEEKVISLNSMFIIEGYAASQETINSFKERRIFLESEDGTLISLYLQEILVGRMQLTQAVLKPTSPLKPFTSYTLKYSDQTEAETRQLTQYNRHTKKFDKLEWRTAGPTYMNSSDGAAITFKYSSSDVVHFGCGPAVHTFFSVNNVPSTEVWFRTEFIDVSNNQKTTFYLKASKGILGLGHGMCSGAFRYRGSGKYKARFIAVNTDGTVLKRSNWKIFDSPYTIAQRKS